MKEGRKPAFTVAIDPTIAQAVDERARGKQITRSAAVEEALAWWLQTLAEQDGEELARLGNRRRASRTEAIAEAKIAAQMVLEALRYQFPAMQELSDHELRQRSLSKLDRSPGGT